MFNFLKNVTSYLTSYLLNLTLKLSLGVVIGYSWCLGSSPIRVLANWKHMGNLYYVQYHLCGTVHDTSFYED